MDPLTALREFTIRDKLDQIVRVGNEFHFGSSYSFPCSIETAYRSKTHNYTLETLVFFIKNQHLSKTDYILNAHNHKIPAVSFLDRKPLIDYLNGTISSAPNIQQTPPLFDGYCPENSQIHGEIDVNEPNYESGVAKDPISMIREGERPLKDREMVLECRNRDFLGVLVAATKRNEERERMESQQRKDGLVAKSRIERGGGFGDDLVGGFDAMPKTKMHLRGSKIGEGVPIILVPSAFQTLITIYNVKEFLEDGVFITTDEKVKKMNGARPECVTVQKKFSRDRVVTAYEVRDKPAALKPEDWERVVAVFVLGKEWQFKDWPFKDHVEIFNKIIGFYMRFEDDSVESAKNVKQWNVKIISISKNKRHQDRAAALEFWDRLEEFIRSRS